MQRIFQKDIRNPDHFVITLELVPGRESTGRSVAIVKKIAEDAFNDGRISAVSITDNPGGNPSLGPDIIGSDIFRIGMDVIVHLTNRDSNRLGMESRALNLAFLGMKNILAITGDYVSSGFGGQGAPVFDLDSVHTQILLKLLSERINAGGDPEGFFAGCAISPFKYTEGESFAQYAKLCRKVAAGAQFIITQLGYDSRKYEELIFMQRRMGVDLPTLGSVYLLTPGTARIMNAGKVPGAFVSDRLLGIVTREWQDKTAGRESAIERAARLGAVLKGLGYQGIHLEGIHKDFSVAGRILDRMEAISDKWESYYEELQFGPDNGFYAIGRTGSRPTAFGRRKPPLKLKEKVLYGSLKNTHDLFFNIDSPLSAINQSISRKLDKSSAGRVVTHLLEAAMKKPLLGCLSCGDCAIQHVGFICPESGCPKHTRNGACGGSRNGACEVFPERNCIWYRAYNRLSRKGETGEMTRSCIPPRLWELHRTSSWLNFHLKRDHQNNENDISRFCRAHRCELDPADN